MSMRFSYFLPLLYISLVAAFTFASYNVKKIMNTGRHTVAEIVLKNINKVYDNGFCAVKDFNLEIEPKEFIIFVGPSGCGKSTTLRMIAGLEEISSGELWFNDILANFLEPRERELSMVFQNYALYPNMTVYKNIAFSLEIRGVSRKETDRRVREIARLLGLEEVLDRRPRDLSGGQRQRVAIGNAIIRNPQLLLMDEPLSNLDAKLRAQMRVELIKLHEQLGNTIIYVTHDQVEAMTLGSRIVVMNEGEIQQADTPERIYTNPINRFVAGFIGSPAMNFLNCSVAEANSSEQGEYGRTKVLVFDDGRRLVCSNLISDWLEQTSIGANYIAGFRPESFFDSYKRDKSGRQDLGDKQKLFVTITHRELLGNEVLLYFKFCAAECCMRAAAENEAVIGDVIPVWVDVNSMNLFDKRTDRNLFYENRQKLRHTERYENENER